jgi:hypothetical protein
VPLDDDPHAVGERRGDVAVEQVQGFGPPVLPGARVHADAHEVATPVAGEHAVVARRPVGTAEQRVAHGHPAKPDLDAVVDELVASRLKHACGPR